MLEPQTLRFLKGIRKHNSKEWFDAHRKEYEAARIDFANFIELVIDDLQRFDTTITGMTAKDCMFRFHRDIRFSADKSPYKTNFGASIKRGGKKSPFAGYYFHCAPGESFAGGGLWMPDSVALQKLRQEIDYNFDEFMSLMKQPAFKKIYGDLYKGKELSLTSAPKGYDKENPAIDYLKLKSFIAEAPVNDQELTSSQLHGKTVSAFKALQPLIHFINRSMEE